jgi:tetratricopeptide (TPR) repeat protein
VGAQDPGLGSLTFHNSGAAEAQDDFVRGVLLLHSFEYGPAAEAFRAAQAADPDFALAYWGEAMTHNHPIWARQDRDAARAVLERYRAAASRAGSVSPTERESIYLDALRLLYAEEGSKAERDRAYMEGMRRLHEAYPEDPEARTFYALAILGLTNGVRDFGNYMRAAAVAHPVFLENPDHPGAAHYIIHAFDDPIHAPLGLPAALAYGASAPDAGHAQHMTSHIFLAMGMWDDVVRANVNATRVQDRLRAEGGAGPNWCGHYSSWLAYGYLMREDWDEAEAIMDGCRESLADPDGDDYGYYLSMRARQIFDAGSWDDVMRWPAAPEGPSWTMPGHLFVSGVAAFERGETEVGREALVQLAEATSDNDDPRTRIMVSELQALNALAQGDEAMAVELLRGAAEREESLPFEFGPPASLKPPHELLGEVLLELDRPAEAVEAFQGALRITPLRTPTLRLLAEAAERAGMSMLAAETRSQIEEIVR